MNHSDTVVIFRLGSLGDTIVALPCFHKIARTFGNTRRIVVTNAPVSPKAPSLISILQGSNLIDGVIEFESPLNINTSIKLFHQIRDLKSATLVYIGPRPNRLSFFRDLLFFKSIGFKRIIGGSPFRQLKPSVDEISKDIEPEAEFLARSISELGSVDLHDRSFWDLRLTNEEIQQAQEIVKEIEPAGFLVISAGGKAKLNNWGYENWDTLLSGVSARWPQLGLFLAGSGDERQMCSALAKSWCGASVNGAGMLSPRETAAVIDRALGFVGHDSGPLHLAAAMNVKCVGIFGDNNPPRRWHPYGYGHRVIHSMDGVCAIRPEVVLKDVLEMLTK